MQDDPISVIAEAIPGALQALHISHGHRHPENTHDVESEGNHQILQATNDDSMEITTHDPSIRPSTPRPTTAGHSVNARLAASSVDGTVPDQHVKTESNESTSGAPTSSTTSQNVSDRGPPIYKHDLVSMVTYTRTHAAPIEGYGDDRDGQLRRVDSWGYGRGVVSPRQYLKAQREVAMEAARKRRADRLAEMLFARNERKRRGGADGKG